MQRFAWLSVASRLTACAILWLGLAYHHCSLPQAMGVLPDAILAFVSWAILLAQAKRTTPA